MKLCIELNGRQVQMDSSVYFDLSIPVEHNGPLNAYYIGKPVFSPYQAGSFTGSVAAGGSVNCFDVSFNPHGNCTHTECFGHLSPERHSVNGAILSHFFICQLISINPEIQVNGDQVVEVGQVLPLLENGIEALAIRTLPNTQSKRSRNHSGSNPAYLSSELAGLLRQRGIKHLLTDMPSVDREEDGGKLCAHHAFWNYPENPRTDATITELIYAPDLASDGLYVLNLQVAPMELDASPSRPVLFPLTDL